jgi:hypothetical protein
VLDTDRAFGQAIDFSNVREQARGLPMPMSLVEPGQQARHHDCRWVGCPPVSPRVRVPDARATAGERRPPPSEVSPASGSHPGRRPGCPPRVQRRGVGPGRAGGGGGVPGPHRHPPARPRPACPTALRAHPTARLRRRRRPLRGGALA